MLCRISSYIISSIHNFEFLRAVYLFFDYVSLIIMYADEINK